MPCDSSYMAASGLEIELSRMLMLIDEVNTGIHVDSSRPEWNGYHEDAYCKGKLRERADHAAKTLCSLLQSRDVSSCSLELQLWWRDHQAADKARKTKR